MAGRNCWPMQIYCWVFITIFKKACQVFYNIHFRWLKRISFSFKTPTSPFSPGWLIIRECTFLIMWEEFFKKLKLYGPFLWMGFNCLKAIEPLRGGSLLFTTKFPEIWNSFIWKSFLETNQVAIVNEFSTVTGWTILFGLFKISFSSGSSTGCLIQRFKSSEISRMVQSKWWKNYNVVLFLVTLLKSYWKGGIDMEDPYFNFVSLLSSLGCRYLDVRLYTEVVDGIGGKQITLILENPVVKKRLGNFGIKKLLWRVCRFSYIHVCYCIQYWRQVFCCDRHIMIWKIMPGLCAWF